MSNQSNLQAFENFKVTRTVLIFVKLIAIDWLSVAHEAVGGGSQDNLLNNS